MLSAVFTDVKSNVSAFVEDLSATAAASFEDKDVFAVVTAFVSAESACDATGDACTSGHCDPDEQVATNVVKQLATDLRLRSERRTAAGFVVGFDMTGLFLFEADPPVSDGNVRRTIRLASPSDPMSGLL